VTVARTSTLPKYLQPMLATLTDAPFDDKGWIFEDKYDGFRMVAKIEGGEVTLYSRNGKIISHNYIEVAKALERVKDDAVIDGELVGSATTASRISNFSRMRSVRMLSCSTARSISCFRIKKIYAACRCWSVNSGSRPFCLSTN
jgi:ATP-dependent DNA ligase